jgi:succinate dehydrogenase / fumarate reductase membrane anchor subunit
MFSLITLSSVDFELSAVADWVGRTPNSVMLVLLILTLGYHSSLGIQVILEDYVHGPMVKVVALILNKFTHIVVASGAVFAVLKLAFGRRRGCRLARGLRSCRGRFQDGVHHQGIPDS